MTRRAVRRLAQRRAAVLGIVAENGTASARDVATALYKNLTETIFDLQMLERQGRIVGEWLRTPVGQPRRRLYRLPTANERAATRALEQRLRAALHAVADPIEGEPRD